MTGTALRTVLALVVLAGPVLAVDVRDEGDAKDWPTYNRDFLGSRFNRGETSLSRENAGQLEEKWRFPAAGSGEEIGVIHATPIVVNGYRLLKRASRVASEQVAEVLTVAGDIPSGYFLVGDDPEHYAVCCWYVANGLMACIIEDGALTLACERNLLAGGAPVFQSPQEVEALVAFHGWPGRRADG